jgi:hypothetical protein
MGCARAFTSKDVASTVCLTVSIENSVS